MSSLSLPRIAAAVFVVIVLVAGGAFLKLGMNPPLPVQIVVQKELPVSRFASSQAQQAAPALPAMPDPVAAPSVQQH